MPRPPNIPLDTPQGLVFLAMHGIDALTAVGSIRFQWSGGWWRWASHPPLLLRSCVVGPSGGHGHSTQSRPARLAFYCSESETFPPFAFEKDNQTTRKGTPKREAKNAQSRVTGIPARSHVPSLVHSFLFVLRPPPSTQNQSRILGKKPLCMIA